MTDGRTDRHSPFLCPPFSFEKARDNNHLLRSSNMLLLFTFVSNIFNSLKSCRQAGNIDNFPTVANFPQGRLLGYQLHFLANYLHLVSRVLNSVLSGRNLDGTLVQKQQSQLVHLALISLVLLWTRSH